MIKAAADAFSDEKEVDACSYREKCSFTLPAGKYSVKAKKGESIGTQEIEIVAGQGVNLEVAIQ